MHLEIVTVVEKEPSVTDSDDESTPCNSVRSSPCNSRRDSCSSSCEEHEEAQPLSEPSLQPENLSTSDTLELVKKDGEVLGIVHLSFEGRLHFLKQQPRPRKITESSTQTDGGEFSQTGLLLSPKTSTAAEDSVSKDTGSPPAMKKPRQMFSTPSP